MKYLLLTLCTAVLLGCSKPATHVRVQNLTGRALTDVTVETTDFGGLAADGFSAPKTFATLNHNPSVQTKDANGDIRNHRVFNDPKGPVGSGKFVVTLTLDAQGGLQVLVRRDDWLRFIIH